MRLSHAATYAVHAVSHLAGRNGTPTSCESIASACGLPPKFLTKVCKLLVNAGLLAGARGPRGGYRLAKPPERITLLEVIEAVEGPLGPGPTPFLAQGGAAVGKDLAEACLRACDLGRRYLAGVRVCELGKGR